MKRMSILLSLLIAVFLFFSCEESKITVSLMVLNPKGKYESIKIGGFQRADTLLDRITDSENEKYKEKDKEKYDRATSDVVLNMAYTEGLTEFKVGDTLKWTSRWLTSPQGMEDASVWKIDAAIAYDIKVYAEYEVVDQEDDIELEEMEASIISDSIENTINTTNADRDFSSEITVKLTGAKLKNALNEELGENSPYELILDEDEDEGKDIFTTKPRAVSITGEKDSDEFVITCLFTGEAENANKVMSGNLGVLIKSGDDFEFDEGYEFPKDGIITNQVAYTVVYEAVVVTKQVTATISDDANFESIIEASVDNRDFERIFVVVLEGATLNKDLSEVPTSAYELIYTESEDEGKVPFTTKPTLTGFSGVEEENTITFTVKFTGEELSEESKVVGGTFAIKIKDSADLVIATDNGYVFPEEDGILTNEETYQITYEEHTT